MSTFKGNADIRRTRRDRRLASFLRAAKFGRYWSDFVAKVGDGKGEVIFSMSGSHLLRPLLLAAGPLEQGHCRPQRLRSTSRGHRWWSNDQFGEPA